MIKTIILQTQSTMYANNHLSWLRNMAKCISDELKAKVLKTLEANV
ncbi:MAG: hypothetical protein IE878_07530 [Epsilonproteobacteria bacterium]|nr:hypothetical protein [Campylobacterota bacterium]